MLRLLLLLLAAATQVSPFTFVPSACVSLRPPPFLPLRSSPDPPPPASPLDSPPTDASLLPPGLQLRQKLEGTSLYLVGMMGSGKSAVSRELASALGTYSALDTDAVIEQLLPPPQTIKTFFEQEGEPAFRKLETDVLSSLHSHVRVVCSTGGGLPTTKANWALLQSGIVVYLDVAPEVLVARLGSSDEAVSSRPVLAEGGEALAEKVGRILGERRKDYELADVKLEVKDEAETVEQTAARAVLATLKFIKENPPKSTGEVKE